ncbi:hypothetical protein, partial [Prevotella sp. 10(H)]|uniref:hypothetical protein n=1 Tax=Prevotella sp. 10(H) TaxID=1158294 RepID=UPI0004A759E3
MKNILMSVVLLVATVLAFTSCDPQDSTDYKLGPIPSADQLSFTVAKSAANPNILEIKNTSKIPGIAIWSFGNGAGDKGDNVEGAYPFKGNYTISLSLYTSGGAETVTQDVTITDDDFSLLDTPMYNALTGGLNNTNGKTWVFDTEKEGHFGVFPSDNSWSWNAAPNEKAESSLYTQEFTFSIKPNGLELTWVNNGWIYTNAKGKDALAALGYTNAVVPPAGDFDVEFAPKNHYTFLMVESTNTLTLGEGAFMGHYAGTSTYKIVKLTEDQLELNCVSTIESGNNWRYIFKPKQ